jgi:nitrite reductase/ring-hydroxylating ferredoxin subunit
VIQSRKSAIDYIESVVKKYSIHCNFIRRPMFLYSERSEKTESLKKECHILSQSSVNASLVNELPIMVNNFNQAVEVDNQTRFNPYLYTQAVAQQLNQQGVYIFENTAAVHIEEKSSNQKVVVTTADGHIITARYAVMATHIPKGFNTLQMFSYPYRSYAIALKLKDQPYPNGNFWNIDTPFRAISSHNLYNNALDTLIIAGSNHKVGQPILNKEEDHFDELKKYIKQYYETAEETYRWSAQHYKTADGLPYIGPLNNKKKRIYLATGYSSDGLVYGVVAGRLIADLITDKPSDFSEVYDSRRSTCPRSYKKVLIENANVACCYIKDFVKNLPSNKTVDIKPGEGKVAKINGQVQAIYCNPEGKITTLSAICPHMKGIVKWNDAEKSWDCPCHGSRFTTTGAIIEGPALEPLRDLLK